MSLDTNDTGSDKLSALFAAYRAACGDPEPNPNFMPMLWRKIESRQTFAFSLSRIARAFVTVAAAVCILMAVVLATVRSQHPNFYSGTYVEMLAADQVDAPEWLPNETPAESNL